MLPWNKIAGARGARAETAPGAVGLAAIIKPGGVGDVIATQLKNDDPAEMVSWLNSLQNDTAWSTVFHVTWKTEELTYAKDGINIRSSEAGKPLTIDRVWHRWKTGCTGHAAGNSGRGTGRRASCSSYSGTTSTIAKRHRRQRGNVN